jgi:hypothetical protein
MNSIIGVSLSVALALGPAEAESAPAEPELSETERNAAALFEQASADFAARRYDDALSRFEAADELVPHPATKYHVARSLEALGRLRDAWEMYGVVAEHPDVSPTERDAAARSRASMRSRLASLRVGEPEGGRVVVDDEETCRTPCTAVLDPGRHDLMVAWPNRTLRRTLALDEGEVLQVDPPPPPPATVSLPRPEGANDRDPPRTPQQRWPTALTWVGAPLAGLGAIGTIAFGARTLAVRQEHDEAPTLDTQDRGLRMRALTNVSLAVGITGCALIISDAIRHAVSKRRG